MRLKDKKDKESVQFQREGDCENVLDEGDGRHEKRVQKLPTSERLSVQYQIYGGGDSSERTGKVGFVGVGNERGRWDKIK